jgi:hypothetical protein
MEIYPVWGRIDYQASWCTEKSMRHLKKMRGVIRNVPPTTMREVMVQGGEQNGVEKKIESFTKRGRSVKIGKERIETMFSETSKTLPVETVDWNRLSPTYPFRFKGPAYLYCVWCEHFIRRVRPSSADLTCSDCGEVLAISCKVRGEEKTRDGWEMSDMMTTSHSHISGGHMVREGV